MLVATIVTAASAYELTITQLDMSKFGTYPHRWEFAAFDFKTLIPQHYYKYNFLSS